MILKAIKKGVVVKLDERPQNVNVGGIYLPHGSDSESKQGVVLNVGSTVKDVQVGDHVLIGQYTGHEVNIDGEKQVVLTESDILMVI